MSTALRADTQLHQLGIRDPIHFVGAILRRHRQSGVHHTPEQWADLEQFLLAELCQMAVDYDPAKNTSLSKYATAWLPARITDWYRQEFVDTRYSDPLQIEPLNENDRDQLEDELEGFSDVLATITYKRGLSPESRYRIKRLAESISAGNSMKAFVDERGLSSRWAGKHMEALRDELQAEGIVYTAKVRISFTDNRHRDETVTGKTPEQALRKARRYARDLNRDIEREQRENPVVISVHVLTDEKERIAA